ncbi:MAG: hypothetical protein ABWW70_06090 [Thermoproteota archaeon]
MELGYIEAAVIAAVSQGITSVSSLARLLGMDENALKAVLRSMEGRGLVKLEEKGLLLKKLHVKLTEKGASMIDDAVSKLRELAAQLEKLARQRIPKPHDVELPPSQAAASLLGLAPMLVWLGLLDAMVLSMLYSALGAADAGSSEGELDSDDLADDWVEGADFDSDDII